MGSSILREQMPYEPIVGHWRPRDCITLRCSTALWIRPSGRRLGEWPPKKTTCFGLGTRTVSHLSHISNEICVAHMYLDLLKEEETTMEDNWKGIKEALTSTYRGSGPQEASS
ncbi:unnamed protein product [Schistosoma margrebowiei]|uniref:Uncharacterized protein n=1 Tax=Schistosoma margrebowiei TaxID=48269 RepID=A0A183MIS4_9TREM|nr:unnamed protein product [Schistosoma margrebowiei]